MYNSSKEDSIPVKDKNGVKDYIYDEMIGPPNPFGSWPFGQNIVTTKINSEFILFKTVFIYARHHLQWLKLGRLAFRTLLQNLESSF